MGDTSNKQFQKQYTEYVSEKMKTDKKNMNRIGIDMININNEELDDYMKIDILEIKER